MDERHDHDIDPPEQSRPESEDPFDPHLCVIEGLVMTYYADPARRTGPLTLTGEPVEPPAKRRLLNIKWMFGLSGLALAACITAAVLLFSTSDAAFADVDVIRGLARQPLVFPNFDPAVRADPNEYQRRMVEIHDLRIRRDDAVHRFKVGTLTPRGINDDLLHAWSGVYRRLRDIGEFDEAGREARALVALIDRNPSLIPYRAVALNDVALVAYHIRDLNEAEKWFLASIQQREIDQQTLRAKNRWDEFHPDALLFAIRDLIPICLNLSALELARAAETTPPVKTKPGPAPVSAARQWIVRAEADFRKYLLGACGPNSISHSPNASVAELFFSLPPDFQSPPESTTDSQVREFQTRFHGFSPNSTLNVLLRRFQLAAATVALAESDTAAAAKLLADGRRIPYWPIRDESRLDFHEPLLAARIAIAAGRFDEPLQHLEEAAQHTGPPVVSNDVANARPIPPARVAELAALRGACLLAKDENDPEGRRLVKESLEAWTALSKNLTGKNRSEFEKQFENWEDLIR
ncbi:MAG TPA: hypothetical protein VNT79_18130 [Phycisphaerae bacterium]|nr:hypothetical protein [Phycisphaerae bacterium]